MITNLLLHNLGSSKLRNVNSPVKRLHSNVIEVTILTVVSKSILSFLIIPTNLSFEFNLLQFPVMLYFAVAINTVQGHSHPVSSMIFRMSSSMLIVLMLDPKTTFSSRYSVGKALILCTKRLCQLKG